MNAMDKQSTYEIDVAPLSEDGRPATTSVHNHRDQSDGMNLSGTARKAGLALGVCALLGCAVIAIASAATLSYAVYIGIPLIAA